MYMRSSLAGLVSQLSSNRKNKFFIHYDNPYEEITTQKVDLKAANIRLMFGRVSVCTCSDLRV